MPVPERYFEAAGRPRGRARRRPAGVLLNAAEEKAAGLARARRLGTKRALVAIAPGAAHATKRWPVEHWIKLVRQIVHTGADIVALGRPRGFGGRRRDRGPRRRPTWRVPPAT